jgi:hypothetical protein
MREVPLDHSRSRGARRLLLSFLSILTLLASGFESALGAQDSAAVGGVAPAPQPAAVRRGPSRDARTEPARRTRSGATPAPAAVEAAPQTTTTSAAPSAVPSPAAAAGQDSAAVDSLLARVQERFQMYPVQQGVLLLPKYAAPGLQSVQVAGGVIAVNGKAVPGSEIASLLGEDAPVVLRLSYVRPELLQQRMLALAGAGATPADSARIASGAPREDAAAATDGAGAPGAPPPGATVPRVDADVDIELGDDPDLDDGDIVRVGHNITVPENQTVLGDVVAIGGDVEVAGEVLGDAVSLGGVLRLTDTARVNGDAVSVGGRLEKALGAQVLGETTSVRMAFPFTGHAFAWEGSGFFDATSGLLVTLLWIALFLIVGSLFVLFANRPLERVEANLRSSPLKAGLVGFLAQVLFLPAYIIGLVLLVITIIGIPIAILWSFGFFVAGFLATLFGFSAVARLLGHALSNRMNRPLHSPYAALLVGFIALFGSNLLANLFNFGPGLMDGFSLFFFILGILVLYLAGTAGFGAVLLTRFGTRTSWSREPPPGYPAPLPSPAAPPAPELPVATGTSASASALEPFPEPPYPAPGGSPGRLPERNDPQSPG